MASIRTVRECVWVGPTGAFTVGLLLLTGVCSPLRAAEESPVSVGSETPPSLLIREVAIVDPSSARLSAPVDILIKDGSITAVETGGSIAAEGVDDVLEARGRYALPGLIDVHAHLGRRRNRVNRPTPIERARSRTSSATA